MLQAYGKPGFACPPTPLPHAGPHATVGCFPDSNGVGISPLRDGYVFTANGGTDDVSVIDLQKALAGDPAAEIARIPVAVGPWGLAVSPTAASWRRPTARARGPASRGTRSRSSTSEKAIAGTKDAEVARVLVGTNNPSTPTRTFSVAFTPDGERIIASNFRSSNVSVIDVRKALAGELAEGRRRTPARSSTGTPSEPARTGRRSRRSAGRRRRSPAGWWRARPSRSSPMWKQRDRSGRRLAYLWLPHGQLVNVLIIREGDAQPLTVAAEPAVRGLLPGVRAGGAGDGAGLVGATMRRSS